MPSELSCPVWSLFLEHLDHKSTDDAIWQSILLCCFFMFLCWFVSVVTNNYSQVDKLWSITPWIYAWMLVVDTRTLVMAILASVWGIRLSFNFWRRGGYTWPPWAGEEDYRWQCLQEGKLLSIFKNRVVWHVFNVGFICIYQHVLLWLLIAPSVVAHIVATQHDSCPAGQQQLQVLDYISWLGMLVFIILETMADNQQYEFQTIKHSLLRKKEHADDNDNGRFLFCQSGLFAWARKPNYAAEQAIWICYYGSSVAALGRQNSSATGWILLVLLFQATGYFTERLTLEKYPVSYAQYQKRVPLYIPCLYGWKRKTDLKKEN